MTEVQMFVYLIGPEGGPLKIGISGRPHKRARQIQTAHPRRVSVFGSWPHDDCRSVEAEAHRLLAGRRLSGEWFDVAKGDAVAAIQQAILNMDSVGGHIFAETAPPASYEEIPPIPDPAMVLPPYVPPAFVMPAPPTPHEGPDEPFFLGYARPVLGVSIAEQATWLEVSGVDPRDIWIEKPSHGRKALEAALKDCRDGDTFLAWSADVIGAPSDVCAVHSIVRQKGATMKFKREAVTND